MLLSSWLESFRRSFQQKRRTNKPRTRRTDAEALEARQLLTVFTWDGTGDGSSFGDPANWDVNDDDPLTAPGINDDVIIDLDNGGTPFTVQVSGDESVRSVIIDADEATLQLLSNGTLTVTADTFIQDGRMLGSGGDLTTATLTNRDLLHVNSSSTDIDAGTFENHGDFDIIRAGGLSLTLTNGFTNFGNVTLLSTGSGGSTTLEIENGGIVNEVSGTITLAAGNGQRNLNTATLENKGRIDLLDANSNFTGRAVEITNTGVFNVASGVSTSTFVSGATFNQLEGTLIVDGSLNLNDATLAVSGGSVQIADRLFVNDGTLEVSGGSVRNDGQLQLDRGTFSFSGGELVGANATELRNTVDATISHDGSLSLLTRDTTNIAGTLFSGQTLTVGLDDNSDLIAQPGFENRGLIVFDNPGTSTQTLGTVAGVTFVNASSGTVRFSGGGSPSTTILASVENHGTFEIDTIVSDRRAATFTNFGNVTITENGRYTRSTLGGGAGAFVHVDGTLNNAGLFDGSGLTFNYNGGDVVGTVFPRVLNIGPNAGNTGTFVPDREISGNVLSGQTIIFTSDDVESVGAFSNAGEIFLRSTALGSSGTILDSRAGLLTNTASGKITFEGDVDEANVLRGNLRNEGEIVVSSGRGGVDQVINLGTFEVAADASLFMSPVNGSFVQDAGLLDINGVTDLARSSTFSYLGGTIDGLVTLRESDLDIAANLNPATFLMTGGGEILSDIPAEATVTLSNRDAADIDNSFDGPEDMSIHGQLILGDNLTTGNSIELTVPGTLTVASDGSLRTEGAAGARILSTVLQNDGAVSIQADASIGRIDANHVNAGALELGDVTATFTGDTLVNEVDGQLTGIGSLVLTAGPFQNSDTVFTNAGTLAPGQSPGIMNISATNSNLTPSSRFVAEIGGTDPGTEHDQVVFNGEVSLGGTLQIESLPEFIPAVGSVFEILQGSNVRGGFATVENLQSDDVTFVSRTSDVNVEVEVQEAKSDLVAAFDSTPSSVLAGDDLTLSITVTNVGSDTTADAWLDRIFLGEGDDFDPVNAVQIAEIARVGGLAAGQSYTVNVDAKAPGVLPGEYRFFVIVDALGQVADRSVSNHRIASEAVQSDVRNLVFEVPQLQVIGDGDVQFFEARVPENLINVPTEVRVVSESGDPITVSVSQSDVPSDLNFDQRSTVQSGNDFQHSLEDARPDSYFFRIEGHAADTEYTIFWDRSELAILDTGITEASNQGRVTTTITGSGFSRTTTASLEDALGNQRAPEFIEFIDARTIRVTWDLEGAQTGAHDVIVDDGGETARCDDCIYVIDAASKRLKVLVTAPAVLRRGVPANGRIDYANEGLTDLAPGLYELATIGGTGKLSNENGAAFLASHLVLLGGQAAESADMPTQSSASLPISVIADQSAGDFRVEVREINLEQDFDWDAIEDQLRPEHISVDAWDDVIYPNFRDLVGTTGEDLRAALQMAAEHLGKIGVHTSDGGRLLAFLVSVAGEHGEIAQRYEFQGLGFGLSDPTDYRVQILDSGDVAVRSPGRVRLFSLAVDGTFVASPGDFGTLTRAADGSFRLDEADSSFWRYNAIGEWIKFTSFNGEDTTPTFNGAGKIIQITDEFGESVNYSRGTDQLIESISYPNGTRVNYNYDAERQHVVQSVRESIDGLSTNGRTSYEFSDSGRSQHALQSVTTEEGVATNFTYNGQGKVSRIVRGENAIELDYPGLAFVSQVVGSGGGTASAAPAAITMLRNEAGQAGLTESAGRVLRQTFTEEFQQDSLTNPDSTFTTITPPPSTDFVGEGFEQEMTDARGNTSKREFNAQLRQTGFVDEKGNRYSSEYDEAGNETGRAYPDGSSEQFSYNINGQVTQSISRHGDQIDYSYDDEGRLLDRQFQDGTSHSYEYDNNDNLIEATDRNGNVTQYNYDGFNQLIEIISPGSASTRFAYDADGRVIETTYPDNSVIRNQYDNEGRLRRLTDGTGNTIVEYAYDSFGRRTIDAYQNGMEVRYEYDDQNRVVKSTTRVNGIIVDERDYEYDITGRVSSQTVNGEVRLFEYNANGQLSAILDRQGTVVFKQSFNAAGALSSVLRDGENNTVVVDENNMVVQFGDEQVTNDRGRMVDRESSSSGATYAYDDEGRLISVVESEVNNIGNVVSTSETNYGYDALGNRVSRTQEEVRTDFIVHPRSGAQLAELDENGEVVSKNIFGNTLVGQLSGDDTIQFLVFDVFGHTSVATSETGEVTNRFVHDPQGNQLAEDSTKALDTTVGGAFGNRKEAGGLTYSWASNTSFEIGFRQAVFTTDPLEVVNVNYDFDSDFDCDVAEEEGDDEREVDGSQDNDAWYQLAYTLGVLFGSNDADARAAALRQMLIPPGQNFVEVPASLRANTPVCENRPNQGGEIAATQTSARAFGGRLGRGSTDITGRELSGVGNAGNTSGTERELNARQTDGHSNSNSIAENSSVRKNVQTTQVASDAEAVTVAASTSEKASSFDPNDILGPAGFGEERFLTAAQTLDYTIRFENLDTAELPAQQVVITQTLDADLDFTTFELGSIGFGNRRIEVPAGRQNFQTVVDLPELNLVLDAEASFNATTGDLTWILQAQDPGTGSLPANPVAGFLPPNVVPGEGEGFVEYQVRAKSDRQTGDLLDAEAVIVFDAEAPIATPAIFNTIDADAPTATVAVLPARSLTEEFVVSWAGDDGAGSGVASFDVFVSEDGGPFDALLLNTTDTSTVFNGEDGKTYAFRAVATDNVGFVEDDPGIAEATTTVDLNDPPEFITPNVFLSPADLLANATAFNRTFAVGNDAEGDFLSIGTGNFGNDKALEIPLVEAGSNIDRLVLEIEADQLQSDDDLSIFLTDGTNMVGIRRGDNLGGRLEVLRAPDQSPIPIPESQVIATGTGFPSDVRIEFAFGASATEVTATTNGITGSAIPTTGFLDGNAALSLVLLGNDATEEYQVRAIRALFSNSLLPENSAVGTVVVDDLAATDPDIGDNLTFSLVAGNDLGAFAIDSASGVISVADDSALDFESTSQFDLTVRVTDDLGAFDEQQVPISLVNVNEAPVVVNPLADVTVNEDSADQVIDLSNVFADVDTSNLTLSAASSDGSLLSTPLNGTDLTLSFPADANGAATVTVSADDGDSIVSDAFTVTVNAVNDAPTVAAPLMDVTVDEDATDQVIDLSGVFADIDSANLTLSAVSSDGSLVTTSLSGTDLTLNFASDANGAATVTVTADDGELTASDTFAVTVNAVNDAPTVAAPLADETVDEDAADQVIDLSGVFADIDSANLTLSAASSDGGLVTTSLSGSELTLSFPANANGAATVTVTADDGELTASDTFAVTVNAVNDAPTVAAPLADVTVDEDAADQVIDLSGVFADIDSAKLTLSAVSSDGSLVTTSLSGTVLTLSFPADANGAATVTVTADDGELTASDTFAVTLNAVNDTPTVAAPLADVTVDEDAADQVIDLSGVFADIDSANLTLSAISSDGSLVTTSLIGTDLTLSFPADANGAATVTVTADDGELTVSDTFAVTVNAVNDAPTVAAPLPDVTVDEDAADQVIDLSGVFADVDSANLTLSVVSSDGSLVTTSLSGTDLTLSFPADANGAATITITADDGELTVSDTFAVTVNAVNDAPTVAAPLVDVAVDEDAADEVIDLSGVFADIDSANLTLSAISSDGSLVTTSLSGTDLTLSFRADANGAATVTVTADDGELTVSDTFAVTVNAVNDAPVVAAPLADVTVDEGSSDLVVDLSAVVADIDDVNLSLDAVSSGNAVTTLVTGNLLTLSFPEDGVATVTVTATDDSGASVSDTFTVTVNDLGGEEPTPGVFVEDGVLKIVGTENDDEVYVTRWHGNFYVFTNIDRAEFTRVSTDDVNSIQVDGRAGNDVILMSCWVGVATALNGGDGHDYIHGGHGADEINGGAGNDWIYAGSGNDRITGGLGNDRIYASWGHDIVYGGDGNDRIFGGSGNDILLGQRGNDILFGQRGKDILIGGDGSDVLSGGSGSDLLITGDTNFDEDEAKLEAMRDLWTSGGSRSARMNAILDLGLEVTHDDDVDFAWGGWGHHWLDLDAIDHGC